MTTLIDFLLNMHCYALGATGIVSAPSIMVSSTTSHSDPPDEDDDVGLSLHPEQDEQLNADVEPGPAFIDSPRQSPGGSAQSTHGDLMEGNSPGCLPLHSAGRSPVRSAGDSPFCSADGSPICSAGGSPVRSPGGSPICSDGGSPRRSVSGSPPRSDGGSPPRSAGGSPPRSDGGSPPRSVSGSPPRSAGGLPPRSAGGSPPRFPDPPHCTGDPPPVDSPDDRPFTPTDDFTSTVTSMPPQVDSDPNFPLEGDHGPDFISPMPLEDCAPSIDVLPDSEAPLAGQVPVEDTREGKSGEEAADEDLGITD